MRERLLLAVAVWACLSVLAWGADDEPQDALTGLWSGTYEYPEDSGRDPVNFSLLMLQEGKTVVGAVMESNTFGNARDPWLHATVEGEFDAETRKLQFNKIYDGTAEVSHKVVYTAQISKDGNKLDEGTWKIPEQWGGSFSLRREKGTGPGPLAGAWEGEFRYPEGAGREPVKFKMLLIHKEQGVTGFIKEENTFGEEGEDPWLHATFKGKVDDSQRFTFVKRYDGTDGVEHDVRFRGTLAEDQRSIEDGEWEIEGDWGGRFTLKRSSSGE